MEKDLLMQNFFLLLELIEDKNYIAEIIGNLFTYLTDKEQENFVAFSIDDMVENYDLHNIINS
ncbi:MAG: hypothetical protein KKF62_02020 [Bacteroidetes bacterium]|nr:hypothetical protein [Bacteroidota bacterium]MBU1115341.1 hypothetical protein [Bacteroidota bacterium]MBU1799670.1 hypothetical protein [Bacteroidota bacterium]